MEHIVHAAYTPLAEQKARIATLAFAIWGGAVAAFTITHWIVAWPLLFFYATLVIDTYFSVRVFSTIAPPRDRFQQWADAVIVILYLGLATRFEQPLDFTIIAALLFLACILKYAILTDAVPLYRPFLHRKIALDSLGALVCLLAAFGIALGYVRAATLALAFLNAGANVYILILKPFYVLPHIAEEKT